MKKTAVIIAIALGFTVSSSNASTPIMTYNNLEIVTTKSQVNPFCTSIAKGDIETVKKLIELGEDVNRKSNGMTPSMYAARYNRVEILKLLLDHGAKLNARSDKGMTALKYAKQSNAVDVIAFIENLES